MNHKMMHFYRIILGIFALTAVWAKAEFFVPVFVPEKSNDSMPVYGQPWQSPPFQQALQQSSGGSFTPQDGDDKKKPPPPAPAADSNSMIWLLPVLRYLIVSDGQSLHLQNNPVVGFLPFVLPVALWWFGSERALELAHHKGEVPVGDPIPVHPQTMDGNGDKGVNSQGSAQSTGKAGVPASSSQSSEQLPAGKNQPDKRKQDDNNQPPDEDPPPAKRLCDRKECPGQLLHQAIRNGDIKRVSDILDLHQNPNERWNGVLPLGLAAVLGLPEICRVLIRHGANTEAYYYQGTILCELIQNTCSLSENMPKYVPVIKVLIEEGANLPESLFVDELLYKKWDKYHFLRDMAIEQYKRRGTDLNRLRTNFGWPVLYVVADRHDRFSPSTLEWLLDTGFKSDLENFGETPLSYLLSMSHSNSVIPFAELLISHGADCSDIIPIVLMRHYDKYEYFRDLVFNKLNRAGFDLEETYLIVWVAVYANSYSKVAIEYLWNRISSVEEVWSRYQMKIMQEILQGDTAMEEAYEKNRINIVIAKRLKWLLDLGFNFTSAPEFGSHPVALLLQRYWDRYPEFREKALEQFVAENMDIGAIQPFFIRSFDLGEKTSLLFYIMSYPSDYSLQSFEWLEEHSPIFREQLASNGNQALETMLSSEPKLDPLLARMMVFFDIRALTNSAFLSIFRSMLLNWYEPNNLFDMILEKCREKEIDLNLLNINGEPLLKFMIMNAMKFCIPSEKLWLLFEKDLFPTAIEISFLPEYSIYCNDIIQGKLDVEKDDWSEYYPLLYLAYSVNHILEKTRNRTGLQFDCLVFLMNNPDIRIEDYPHLPPTLVKRATRRVLNTVQELIEEERPEFEDSESDSISDAVDVEIP